MPTLLERRRVTPRAFPPSVPRRVLVIEDYAPAARGLRALLVSRGYGVDLAADSTDALRRVMEQSYGLVVADFDLGVEDGVDLVRRIRRLRPGLPVLAVTARDLDTTGDLAREGAIEELLEKPVDPRLLLAAVERYLADRPVGS